VCYLALVRKIPALLALTCLALAAQTSPESDVVRVGPGVKPPILTHKEEPTYTDEARSVHLQGNVMLGLIVDTAGQATDIRVLSPLGFGLDENAEAAVRKWRFKPGTKDGKPVKIEATVQVNFRLPEFSFNDKYEQQRTDFNVSITGLKGDDKRKAQAVEKIQKLSQQSFAPAMYLESVWLDAGDLEPKNPDRSRDLLMRAAAKHYGPALFVTGKMYLNGHGVNADPQRGWQMIRDASLLGSAEAQFFLGTHYEAGDGVERDIERAQRSFRLCAAAGQAPCQYRLASLLLTSPGRRERDYVQALAWLELAAAQGLAPANSVLDKERPKLTEKQIAWISDLKQQLVQMHN
jgi:TonB family protein